MPNKRDEENRNNIKKYEESLPDSERNPNVQENAERLIELAAQPLPRDVGTPRPDERYSEKQTRSHKTGDTSDSRSDTSHQ